jgi:hypothetical protein
MATLNPLGPVAGAFYLDNSEVACIMGPVGSAKTTAACLRAGRHIMEEHPKPDGVKRSRWCIVRNTGPQLRDTTIKTWLEIYPESVYGKLVGNPPRQLWNFKPRGSDNPIYAEILFRSLDDASDVANLLSLEVTGFLVNELKLIAPEIIQHMGRRAGRAFGGGSKWSGWIADTNPWGFESYCHEIFVVQKRPGYAFFKQPGGMDPDAENLENLAQTAETLALPWNDPVRREQGRQYYIKALRDYSANEASQYVHCNYGASRDGKAVYDAFNDSAHCKEVGYDKTLPLSLGYDCSGRNPAAIIGQTTREGQHRMLREFIGEDVGMREHAERCKRYIETEFPGAMIERITGDPAGAQRDSNDIDSFRILREVFRGVQVLPARTNDPRTRVEAVNGAFRRLINGEPALLIDPLCKVLRAACTSRYQYRKLKLSGVSNQFSDEPSKTHPWSDVADAVQYYMLGAGEGRLIMGRSASEFGNNAIAPKGEWDVFSA